MAPPALLSIRGKVYCGFLSPLKIHRRGRVRTCDLWVQWQTLTTTPPRRLRVGEMRVAYKSFIPKDLGMHKDNIKMNVKKIGYLDACWFCVAQNVYQWWTHVNKHFHEHLIKGKNLVC
jgi:hypothetical protein